MFPPETMQTTRPSPPRPASAAASGERACPFGDDARPRREQRVPRRPSRRAGRQTPRRGAARARSHIAGSSSLRARRRRRTTGGSPPRPASPAANDAASGAAVAGCTAIHACRGESCRSALAIPVVSPPPPQGTSTASIPSSCSDELEPDRRRCRPSRARRAPGGRRTRRARDTRRSSIVSHHAVARHRDHVRRRAARPRRAWRAARGRERRPWPARRARGRPSRPPGPCSPRSSSTRLRATRPDAACRMALARAAELERADRLQALELEPDLAGRVDVEPHERAGPDGDAGGDRPRALDRGRAGSERRPRRRCPARAPGSTQSVGGGEVLDREPERLEERQLARRAAARVRADEQLAQLGDGCGRARSRASSTASR